MIKSKDRNQMSKAKLSAHDRRCLQNQRLTLQQLYLARVVRMNYFSDSMHRGEPRSIGEAPQSNNSYGTTAALETLR